MVTTRLWDGQDKYGQILVRISRTTGLVMPFLVVCYGLLAAKGVIARSDIFTDQAFYLCSAAFITLGLVQYFYKAWNPRIVAIYLLAYHILGALFLIFVSGFASPLVISWLVLIYMAELFFGRMAFVYSIALLMATALVSFAVTDALDINEFISYLAYVVLIVAAAVVSSRLRSIQFIQEADLERTRNEEQLQRGQLMTLINSINESIISISAPGTIRVYNAATLNLLDTNQSLTGQNIDDVFNIYDTSGEPVPLVSLLSSLSRLTERDDLIHRFADGEQIRLSISAAPIKGTFSNQHMANEGYLFIFRDITKSKSLEEERDEFISVVSHELRTPITIAEGTLSNMQVLMERGMSAKDLSTNLKEAHEQVIFLASMVNDLGTLSRAERGIADAPEDIKVSDMLHELFTRYHGNAEDAGLTLNLDAPARLGTIQASPLYLEEMLQNFITNAIKYTKEGSVTISAKRTKDGILFAVKDTGIGMSKTDLKHIFEKFYRSEDYRTRETSGTGLGLYVVNKLARKLHTKVEVSSRLNHGSTFSFLMADKKKS